VRRELSCASESSAWPVISELFPGNGLGGGLVDMGRLPDAGRLDERGEEGAGEWACGVGSFGVPLDGDDKVVGGVEFDGLDDTIGGRDGADAQVVSCLKDSLVVTGIDCGLGGRSGKPSKARTGGDVDWVGFDNLAAGAVVDVGFEDGVEILNEGTVAPDIEGLGAVADAEDRFVEVEGIL
jgi:hypothetical protein